MQYSKDFFRNGGTGEIRTYIHLKDPSKIDNLENLKYYDATAARDIIDLQEKIEFLKQYRADLAERSRAFFTANYTLLLSLKRDRSYFRDGKVYYIITIHKIFDNPTIAPEAIHESRYKGTERHEAFKEFEALKKQYPGIKFEKDIEKKSWEK